MRWVRHDRQAGKASARQRHGEVIQRTLAWADSAIAPHATLPVYWKPLLDQRDAPARV